MPVSTVFKDLNITFEENLVTKDLKVTKNSDAIKRSVMNLVLTQPGERFFNPNIGCRVRNLLFDPLDFITAAVIKSEIEYTIKAFEPRVVLKNVNVDLDEDNNGFDVVIEYTIIGKPAITENIDLFLERSRA
jgi:phage baseplate assembly protein W